VPATLDCAGAREGVAGTWRSLVAHLTGGQGVAGSNPVVPTAVGSPLVLVIIPGQRAFLILCGGLVVDLGCWGMGTICGPSVDTARFSRGYDHKSRRDCTSWQTTRRRPRICRFTVRCRSEATTPAFRAVRTFFTSSSRADTVRTRRRCIRLCARSRSAPRARRAAGARHEDPASTHQWSPPGQGGAPLCGAASPASSPLRVLLPPAPPRNDRRAVIMPVARGSGTEGPAGSGVNGLTPGPLRPLGRLTPAGQGPAVENARLPLPPVHNERWPEVASLSSPLKAQAV
jgi:hypothetical protein